MFSIYRHQSALVPLREVWEKADAALRDAILRASETLDQILAHDPSAQGEGRDGPVRILLQAPMGVLFEVDEEKKLVRILRAWVYRVSRDKKDPRV
jgi:hypothetical protein